MISAIGALLISLVSLFSLDTARLEAWYKGSAANPYANACGTQPAGQNWCVGPDGWTVVTPTIGTTGTSCATTGTPTWDGSCITYVSDRGTGTLATCRINAPVGFDFTTDPTNGGSDWTKACPMQPFVVTGLRTGSSDFLLLQRGSCFIDSTVATNPCTGAANTTTTYGIGANTDRTSNLGNRAGTSSSKPIVIAAFGPIAVDRPKFMTINYCVRAAVGTGNIMVMHIECTNPWRDPRSSYFLAANPAVSSGAGQKNIVTVAASPTAPLIRVTVASTADLAAQPIYIASVGGVTTANGTWTSANYTIASPTEIDLLGSNIGSQTYTSGGTVGQRTITVTNPLPAEMGNGTSFRMYNYSNAAQMRLTNGDTGLYVSGVDTARTTVTLAGNITVGGQATAGDAIRFIGEETGIKFAVDSANWVYVEGSKISFGSFSYQPSTLGVKIKMTCNLIRNVIEFSYGIQTRYQGIFLGDTLDPQSTCQIRENMLNNNGWMLSDPDCMPLDGLPAKCGGVASEMPLATNGVVPDQSHGAYNHEWFGKTDYIGNILTNNSGAGSQLRAGGLAYNNFAVGNATNLYSGGIMFNNVTRYNVVAKARTQMFAISKTTAATVSGNTLTFSQAPIWIPLNTNYTILNATTGVSFGARQITAATPTTVTLNGAAFSAAIGDTFYFFYALTPQWGIGGFDNAGRLNAAGDVDPLTNSVSEWNIAFDATSAAQSGIYGGFGHSMGTSTIRLAGSSFTNNWVRNWNLGLEDRSQIQGVDGNSACAGLGIGGTNAIRIQMKDNFYFMIGDPIVLSGVAGITGTVNGSFTVASKPSSGYLCLAGSSYTSGTWTAGTGVINGGVTFANNRYSGVNTIADSTQSAASFSSFAPSGTMTVEYCDAQLGGSGYLSDFVNRARENRLGNWNLSNTANAINNCIRSQTDPSIALQ